MTMQYNPTAPRPPEETEPLRDRRETNPMFNDNKMKLGLFGTNCSYGLVMSHAPSTYEVTWAHTKEIAQRADALGLEALVPIARWKGFGGTTNFNGNCFETYTWAAGLAEATENIAIFATSHLPAVHPIVAAKMATTIDHISGGRFGLNLVMGWVTPRWRCSAPSSASTTRATRSARSGWTTSSSCGARRARSPTPATSSTARTSRPTPIRCRRPDPC
jgi:dimethylsulfone monooxygenase